MPTATMTTKARAKAARFAMATFVALTLEGGLHAYVVENASFESPALSSPWTNNNTDITGWVHVGNGVSGHVHNLWNKDPNASFDAQRPPAAPDGEQWVWLGVDSNGQNGGKWVEVNIGTIVANQDVQVGFYLGHFFNITPNDYVRVSIYRNAGATWNQLDYEDVALPSTEGEVEYHAITLNTGSQYAGDTLALEFQALGGIGYARSLIDDVSVYDVPEPNATAGDIDADGDVDNADMGRLYGSFTGPLPACSEDRSDHADLIYSPATGVVKLDPNDADGEVITTFALENAVEGFNAPGTANLPFDGDYATDTPGQISDTDVGTDPNDPNDITGFSSTWNLGAICSTNMSLAELESFLTTASYVGDVGTGATDFDLIVGTDDFSADLDDDGDVDNVDFGILFGNYWGPQAGGMDLQLTPEPASLLLLGMGGIGVLLRKRRGARFCFLLTFVVASLFAVPVQAEELEFNVQHRNPVSGETYNELLRLDSSEVALINIDWWNGNCWPVYTQRGAAYIPRLNEATEAARDLGIQVIWQPSQDDSTYVVDYEDYVQRQNMIDIANDTEHHHDLITTDPVTPMVEKPHQTGFTPYHPSGQVMLPPDVEFPICGTNTRLHKDVHIAQEDLIGKTYWPGQESTHNWKSTQEMYNYCEERGITTLLYTGFATNFCVTDTKPVGIEFMKANGLNTIVVGDLTDAVSGNNYHPTLGQDDANMTPDKGTRQTVAWQETYYDGSITATQLLKQAESPTSTYYEGIVGEENLLSYWRFDSRPGNDQDFVCDVKTNQGAWNAESVELGQPGALSGSRDTAVAFDGTDNAAMLISPYFREDLSNDSTLKSLSAGSFTVEAWVQVDGGQDSARWIMSHDDGTAAGTDFLLGLDANNCFTFLTRGENSQVTATSPVSANDIDSNRWFHVVGVQDTSGSGTIKLYVDGTQVDSDSLSGSAVSTSSSLQFGSRGATDVDDGESGEGKTGAVLDAGSQFFTGVLDEVAIYDAALSATSVRKHCRLADAGAPDNEVVEDAFGDGALGTNSDSGTGWTNTSDTGGSATESGGTARLTTTGDSGIGSMVGKDKFRWFDDTGATISWRWRSEETADIDSQTVDFGIWKDTITFASNGNQPTYRHDAGNDPEGTPSVILYFSHSEDATLVKFIVSSPDGTTWNDETTATKHVEPWVAWFPYGGYGDGWSADNDSWLDVEMKLNKDGYMITFSEPLEPNTFSGDGAWLTGQNQTVIGSWAFEEEGLGAFWNDWGDVDWTGGEEAVFAVGTGYSGGSPINYGTILVDDLVVTDSTDISSGTTPGDADWDGDVDNVDFGALYGAFTGPLPEAGTDNGDRGDLIYDPATGNVMLDPTDAHGGVITNFVLENAAGGNDFSSPGTVDFYPFISSTDSDTATQISQSDMLMEGFSIIMDLGNIFPTGMSLGELDTFLTEASYVGTVGSGYLDFDLVVRAGEYSADFDDDGDVDNVDFGFLYGNYTGPLAGGMDLQVTPEPATLILLGIGSSLAVLRRRGR